MTVPRGYIIILLFAIVLCINETLVLSFPFLKFRKYHVIVLNGLEAGGDGKVLLGVHCKSKDDDLGIRFLDVNQEFEWRFRTNVLETTLFFCGFSWVGGRKVFDAFKDDPDFLDGGCGGRHCTWKAQEDGIYLYNLKQNNYKLVYKWD
ncbi:hypothetical protein V2J09_007262 [Rumex salicifolius]